MRLTMTLAALTLAACAQEASEPTLPLGVEAAAEAAPEEDVWNYEAHVKRRAAEIDAAPVLRGGVLFVGDSITEGGGDWSERFPGVATANHGVGGDTTGAVMARMDQVARGTPERVFLMIGTNDFGGASAEDAAEGALAVAEAIRLRLPDAALYVQSVLPREAARADMVRTVNAELAANAGMLGYTYLDIYPAFATPDGTLRPELTEDDLHLTEPGYALWASLIDKCVREGCEGV